jgi:hypothetical protein
MLQRMKVPMNSLMITALAVVGLCVTEANAQKFREDFDEVTGSGGGPFYFGQGFGDTEGFGWDDGLVGEDAFGNTAGNVRAEFSAEGLPTGGVDGTGAGQLSVGNINRNLLQTDFGTVEADGPVTIVQGGPDADTDGFVSDWNSGLFGESAFAGAAGGAIIGGDITIEGCLGCGLAGGEGIELDVNDVDTSGTGSWFAGFFFETPGFPTGSGPFLFNGGIERNGGELAPWIGSGNVFADGESQTPRSGNTVMKMFGTFSGSFNSSTVVQDIPAGNGETWELECFVRHNDTTGNPTGDFMRAGQTLEMKIRFFDSFDNVINSNAVVILDETDPTDVWIPSGAISLTSVSPNTQRVQVEFKFTQPDGTSSGAALIDDISFTRTDAGAAAGLAAFLGQFEASALVKGTVNTGAGEVLGNVQIRIEDTDGDRLALTAPASTSFQVLGDTLDMFTEQNVAEQNSNGAFNPASDSFRVVIAFDNQVVPTWGTGGLLTVDDVIFTNSFESAGDNYVAALIWEGLPSIGFDNLDKLFLQADVNGSVPGGNFQVRLEGFNTVGTVDEDFSSITTNAENQIQGPSDPGGEFRNWNAELANDLAFFGLGGGGGVITTTGGVFARACLDCGVGGSEAIQLEVLDVAPNADGIWFAGFVWENQTLGSDDLNTLTLQADLAGDWIPGFLQSPVEYMLRIEDSEGDFLGFEGVFGTQNSFVPVGGPLANFNTNGSVGGSDSVFDIDTNGGIYKVVVVFVGRGSDEDPPFGNFGGTITVDNISLSPGGDPVRVQAGVVGYEGVATGTWQTIGGILADATSSTFFGVGGIFAPTGQGDSQDWAAGLEGEEAFSGEFGGNIDNSSAQGCVDCGTNGTGGGSVSWEAFSPNWFVGVAWRPEFAATSLSQIRFKGKFRTSYTGPKANAPTVFFKLEDFEGPPNVFDRFVEFNVAATNGWVSFDDTLDNFDNINAGGPTLTGQSRAYSLVISNVDPFSNWGTGNHEVFFDNLEVIVNGQTVFSEDFNTAVGPGSTILENGEGQPLDDYTVVVSIEDGLGSWGPSGGTLAVDNINLALAASCDGDPDLDLADFAAFQRCFGGNGTGPCECADTDADGDVDLADYKIFEMFFDGPQ